MRLNLVVPIGVVVAVAVICVVVAVLTSAHRADEVSLDREQQLIQRAIAARGERILREVASVAATERATLAIRADYDSQWVERSIGAWLSTFFDHDVVVVVDGSDQINYKLFRSPGDPGAIDLRAQLAPSLDLLRGRLAAMPSGTIAVLAQNPRKPGRRTALIQHFAGRAPIVAAVAVGTDADLAVGNDRAPIVLAVKYIDEGMLREVGNQLQLAGRREIDDPGEADGQQVANIADPKGDAIVRLAWTQTRPGGEIMGSVLPFVAVAGRRLRAARRLDDPLYAAGDGRDRGRRDAAAPPRPA
jgi:diguanylate cyclase